MIIESRFTNPWAFKRGIPLTESQRPKPEFIKSETFRGRAVPMREKILQDALKIVTQDRNKDYGEPENNFSTIAEFWSAYLHNKGMLEAVDCLTSSDVAAMMILMKCSRLATSPDKEDHWTDIAGYAACGGQCACRR